MSRITDGIYSLESTGFAHVFLIHRESSILIDTGLPHKSRAILKEIAALGVDPRTIGNILLTHHDIDHAGNVNALRAATGADVLRVLRDEVQNAAAAMLMVTHDDDAARTADRVHRMADGRLV